MDFSLSEDQRMLQASIQGFLDTAAPLEAVRKAAGGDVSVPVAISGGLLELGVGQAVIPEAYGGLGLGLLEAALVQEALGSVVAPARFLGGVMAAVGIGAAGDEALKAEWLGKLASGDVAFGVAVTERVGAREGAGVTVRDGKLSGRSLFALDTAAATHVLVCDRGGGLHIAEAGAVRRTPLRTIDRTRDFAELEFDGAPAVALSDGDGGVAADRMLAAGRVLLAADTLGAAQTMLDKAVNYAKERKQFNRVIGSFQSVKHMCAEMAAELEPARALVWHAAHALDEDMDEAALLVCLAKAHLAEVGTFIAKTATEVHGGMGFTDLLGLHYWFKRIGANRQLLGGPEQIRAEAAALQGWQ
ncbi:MAG: acyl-CoA dehydrogenase family protein [Henriciella sp.]|nr:acyl-CoA dehydrogenase family protein [Henriciella sp.]